MPETPSYYANTVEFAMGVYDLAMTFGQQDRHGAADPAVRVQMSPQHALVSCALLMKNLRAYERIVGPIALPADLVKKFEIAPALEAFRGMPVPTESLGAPKS